MAAGSKMLPKETPGVSVLSKWILGSQETEHGNPM